MKNIFSCIQLIFLITILSGNALYSQEFYGTEAMNKIKEAERVRFNPIRKSIDFVQLKSSTEINESNHFSWLTDKILKTNNASTLQLKNRRQDKQDYVHYQYKQYYKGLPVEYSMYKAHFKEGKLESVNGEYYSDIHVKTTPSLSKAEAFSKALLAMKATKFKDANSIGLEDSRKMGELLILPLEGKMYLAYKFDIYAVEPLKRVYVYIDAQSGKVLYEENRIHHIDTQGSALTGFSGTQEITTDSMSSGIYRLQETGRGNGIRTKNLNNGASYNTATDFTDNDNVWNTSTIDKFAYDAHFGAERTYDFFSDNFGLNSYDGAGAIINSFVHYDNNYVNAFWDGTQMTYGDGDSFNYSPLTSIEIVGHEITHAVTMHSAGLAYAYESGALNESFSDIFGATIRFLNTPSTATWYIGDQIVIAGGTGIPFRNMSDPNQFSCADTYGGRFWNYGDIVHFDSGVQNFWYYLLTTGGSGTNDIGNSYTVSGIGLDDAAAIAFRNLHVYLTPNSTFSDARFYAIQAAEDLFGPCSNQVIQTTNAWYAVGVGGIYSNTVIATFSPNQNYFCDSPFTVNFSNTSLNATNYSWNFGDGTPISNIHEPTHTYASIGIYTVTLIANGTTSCAASDTMTITNCITTTIGGTPNPANCTPSTSLSCCDIGIRNFQFASINKSSDNAIEGYRDFTCGNYTTITAGDPVRMNVWTSPTISENVKAWIDYNNNSVFDSLTEQVFLSLNKKHMHSGIVHTDLNSILNTPVRLRITDDHYTKTNFGPCSNSQNGQTEDYTITFVANNQAPVADFIGNDTLVSIGGSIKFDDLSIHAPTSWLWTFEGGIPFTSTNQNPLVRYDSVGVYQVKLSVSNSFGTDSTTKIYYINVVSAINLCSVISTTAKEGIFYDSGGLLGNYSALENCTLLIEPTCALSITLNFAQFDTETFYDVLSIYDGSNTSGNLLLSVSGSIMPASVTAYSGKMFIVWRSNTTTNNSGFEVEWTSILSNFIPPISTFSVQYTNPPIATLVQFTDHTLNEPLFWDWDFGDGSFSSLQNPKHSFNIPGIHTIRLITRNCFSADTSYETINVQESPTISINVDSIYSSLECNEDITIPITIFNTGAGDLLFNFVGQNPDPTVHILAFTYGVDLLLEYPNTIGGIGKYFSDYNLDTTNSIDPAYFQNKLIGKDVLLMSAQKTGSTNHIPILGPMILDFVIDGGTVIVCGSLANGSQNSIYSMGLFTGNYILNTNSGIAIASNLSDDFMNGIPPIFNMTTSSYLHNITNTDKIVLASNNGDDLITYRNIGAGKALYLGFNYHDVNDAIEKIISNAVRFSKGKRLLPWISVDTLAGSILPNDSSKIDVTIFSHGLNGGAYNGYLYIYSNDLLKPIDSIFLSLNIGNEICANISHSILSTCSGQVEFIDSSSNAPLSWDWDFGDGTNSSIQNPEHLYNDTGTYVVRLIVCNTINCDTAYKPLTITGVSGPKVSSCTPLTTSYCCDMGIISVHFNDITNTSQDAIDGYSDYSCDKSTSVIAGLSYPINVLTGSLQNENLKVWIDYNNNRIFENSTEQVFTSMYRTNHSGIINISNTSVTNIPLRMRISSDIWGNNIFDGCINLEYGQAEDYTVIVLPNTLPPATNFGFSILNSCSGEVHFSDSTGNSPISWYWDFGDGTNSILQNPVHFYSGSGTYLIKLITSNPFGTDTLIKNLTVNVLASTITHSNNLYTGQAIQFSSNAGTSLSYLWNFGDGHSDTLISPNHSYTNIGTYFVTLTLSNASCSIVITDTLHIGHTSIENIDNLISFELFPNPSKSEINISYQIGSMKNISLEVFDILGKSVELLVHDLSQPPGIYPYTFFAPEAGVYFIRFMSNGESLIKKVVKM